MDSASEIKSCPFCGSPGAAVAGSYVRCGSCGAAGPYSCSEAEAVERWNERMAGVAGAASSEMGTDGAAERGTAMG